MSAPTPATLPRPAGLKILFHIVVSMLALALIGVSLGAGWFYYTSRSALPQVDGTIRMAGLSAPLKVVRDAQGVPHISAANLLDLCFAQGYITAQDRLWQMDMTRRFAAGELSEVLGPQMLTHDREQRILQIRATADRIAAAADPVNRSYMDAYTRGVNAFIEAHRGKLPIEFRVMRYEPKPWQPRDGLMIGVYMSELLSLDGGRIELGREKILAKLSPELAADLYPTSSWHDRPPSEVRLKMDQVSPDGDEDEDEDGVEEMQRTHALRIGAAHAGEGGLLPGSNDWVISGEHTTSGKPLLANDTHLPHSIPNTWYEVHLQTTGNNPLDVAGFSLPGAPFVIVGHNRRVAWGFTNTGADVTDLYLENFNVTGEYQTPEGFRAPEIQHENIRVKGQSDASVDVIITRHGPIVTDLIPGETRKLALKWTVYEGATSLAPFADVDAAQNWDEFQRALSRFDSPSQNAVYADVDGHIGYHATGKVPIHPQHSGAAPLLGSDPKQEWAGYIPFEGLPSAFDPPGGVIATANNRITPKKYPYPLLSAWEAPFRVERIYRVLESGRKFSASDMIALQTDIFSEFDRFCAERFVYAVDHSKQASARSRQAADLMRAWDGRMSIDAAAPVIETQARKELWRRLLEPKLGADHALYSWHMTSVALENILVHQPQRWLPKEYATFDDLLAGAVEHAVTRPRVPNDLSTWRWGNEHPLYLQHPVFGRVPLINRWSGPGWKPQSGGSFTVKQVGREFGPSERMTVDLANLDSSTMNLVTGECGQLFSSHYMDQFRAWYEGYSFVFPFSKAAVNAAKKHELTLEPAEK
jgi:penicillin amidase